MILLFEYMQPIVSICSSLLISRYIFPSCMKQIYRNMLLLNHCVRVRRNTKSLQMSVLPKTIVYKGNACNIRVYTCKKNFTPSCEDL